MARGNVLCRNPATGTLRAHAWDEIRQLGKRGVTFSLDALLEAAGAEPGKSAQRSGLRKYLTALVGAGILEVTATTNGKAAAYRLLRDPGPRSPILRAAGGITDPNRRERPPVTATRQDSLRARAWRVMRNMGQRRECFDAADIAFSASEDHRAADHLRPYLRALSVHGYLAGERGHDGRVSYRMVRDTGPLSPILRRGGSIYDPNERREYAGAEQ